MKRALVYTSEFTPPYGGGEFLPLALAAELQKTHRVTLALNWSSDVARAAATLGIPVDLDRLDVVTVKPRRDWARRLDAILPFWRTRALQRLARGADLCISTVNLFDFGKPAHHFVYLLRQFGDNAFLDFVAHRPPLAGPALFRRRARTFLAETLLRPLLGMRSTRRLLADPRERVYPTSRYVEGVMRGFYGPFSSAVFYPPTVFAPVRRPDSPPRDPFRVVSIGHLFPEKRPADFVAIVEKARALSGLPLTLALAGGPTGTPCFRQLERLAESRPWFSLAGDRRGTEKEDFLLSAAFALHAERDEAFGIAVTEYLKSGVVPIVPDEGGTPEIVSDPDLAYRDIDDAARILARLASDPAFLAEKRHRCADRAAFFSPAAYFERQRRLLDAILNP